MALVTQVAETTLNGVKVHAFVQYEEEFEYMTEYVSRGVRWLNRPCVMIKDISCGLRIPTTTWGSVTVRNMKLQVCTNDGTTEEQPIMIGNTYTPSVTLSTNTGKRSVSFGSKDEMWLYPTDANREIKYNISISGEVLTGSNPVVVDPWFANADFTVSIRGDACRYLMDISRNDDDEVSVNIEAVSNGLSGVTLGRLQAESEALGAMINVSRAGTVRLTGGKGTLNVHTDTPIVKYADWKIKIYPDEMSYMDGAEAVITVSATRDLWSGWVEIPQQSPAINSNGRAFVDLYVYNRTSGTWVSVSEQTGKLCRPSANGFEVYIDNISPDWVTDKFSYTPDIKIKADWVAYEPSEVKSHEAFFSTTRNMNFSNGLANNVFLGGTTSPNFTSRVWYSYVNNPLYFPDTNYIEVGSNDTAVMGLVKIGEYLGIVKQGNTRDSSIYIAYPTSFDEDTAYAVKPTTNGIGACAKYCFNVLGDETLFLSNEGVMAITPRTDDEEDVKNRSYFIDGRLLKEKNLEDAYSFVWRGFYLLAVPNDEDNGHVYLLDGNQRNSWGNDKTNLVYEGYFWDNVPAKQFAKFKKGLWFTDGHNLCRFKTDDDERPYNDNGEAIKAEWSTILDDDGSAYYYKNLKKKGSMLTLLPSENGTSCEVYMKVDNGVEQIIGEANFDEISMPVDFYFNKKLKKYKRLQIIAKNEVPDQGFGIDQIVKLYTVGTYSK